MNEFQITAALIGVVVLLIGLRAVRRKAAVEREEKEREISGKSGVSYSTGRDESQWRRAYSRS
jgi:hypothetical protein